MGGPYPAIDASLGLYANAASIRQAIFAKADDGVLDAKRDYGAAGDCKVVFDAVVTAGSTTITSATANFTSADVGKVIAIPYAGADSGGNGVRETHLTTIASVTNSTTAVMTAAAVGSIVGSRTLTNVSTTYNSSTVTSSTGSFTAGDLGKEIFIPNAGFTQASTSGGDNRLTTRIVAINSSTSITVAHRAQATLTNQTVTFPGAQIIWGTNDTTALQNAHTAASTNRRPLYLPAGRYLTTASINVDSKLTVEGAGPGNSILQIVGSTAISVYVANSGYTLNAPLLDVTIRNFEIDGSGCRGNTYQATRKGIFIRPCRRLTIENMYVHRTSATAIGCDYLPESKIINNVVAYGGTQAWEIGGGGGSGIGIGTGWYPVEDVYIAGNRTTACGNNGIFTESQSSNIVSRGVRIAGNYSAFNGNDGISDRACDGTIISNNVCEYNLGSGISITSGFVNSLFSTNTLIESNVIAHGNDCISIAWKTGAVTIRGNRMRGFASPSRGFLYVLPTVTGATNRTLTIVDNEITGEDPTTGNVNNGRGIYLFGTTSTIETVIIERNRVVNAGRNSSPYFPAIAIALSAVSRLYVRGNTCYDTRGSKRQAHGLVISSGTISKLVWNQNDFADNATGTHDFTGATISSTVTEPNP